MRRWMVGLATAAGLLAPMIAQAQDNRAAFDYITNHIWACSGETYNNMVPGNYLRWELQFLVSLNDDDTFKAGTAKMFYTLDDTTYTAMYNSPGYAFGSDQDGTGVYFERMIRSEEDDISKYELVWLNYMKLVVRVPPGQSATPPFRLEGQLQLSSGDINTVTCQARTDR